MPSRRDLANAIRALSMDAVQQANSGHPGMPMGMADIAEVLWNDFLKHNPSNTGWVNRDRFVVSNGHGSMLLYSLLHLTGYDLPLSELKNFRQLGSKTPGHPEYGLTPGVETTTGPLGQGLANAVGMALAEQQLAATYNRPEHNIIDHNTYVFVGDGCLMEGISHEVCSLAGTLKLGKLIVLYDDNNISIDGELSSWYSEDVAKRFEAYGWHVVSVVDGHDADAIKSALTKAKEITDRPSILCCQTQIGYGSPNKAGSASTHGAPLGTDEITATRQHLGWEGSDFEIPQSIYAAWDARSQGARLEADWQESFDHYQQAYPELAAELKRRLAGQLPEEFAQQYAELIQQTNAAGKALATRAASQNALDVLGPALPELLGGSADLTGSNNTKWQGAPELNSEQPTGRYIHYGVREFGMSAIMNGIALHGGFIPYGGTFLVFSDYARNAIRMAALMHQQVIFVLSHDSIGLGEDGPTHQPVEHLASLRLIPNLTLWRPSDAVETAIAWQAVLAHSNGPSCMVLSRQKLKQQPRNDQQLRNVQRGGYILVDSEQKPELIIMATGSEVELACAAAEQLKTQGRQVRVVSIPSVETFARQDNDYRATVLPADITARIAIEAGVGASWYQYIGIEGKIISLERFGESAPAEQVFEHFGFTVADVVRTAQELL